MLYEYTVQGNYLSVVTYVKFTNDILLGFFLTNKWIEENGFNLDLFRKIYKFYENNNQLQTGILKYLIKFAFKENNADILKNIFLIFEGENKISFEDILNLSRMLPNTNIFIDKYVQEQTIDEEIEE